MSVTLACENVSSGPAILGGRHHLVEIDYDAATVHEHTINDNGDPATANGIGFLDDTFPAQVTDSTVVWSYKTSVGVQRNTLGRYSGTLTLDFSGDADAPSSFTLQCQPWTAPARQRKF